MISTLIIGTGSIGERHLRAFQATGRCLVSACEPNEALRQKIEAIYACSVYPSLAEAFEANSFDAAILCTPANTHISIARACIAAGLHLLVEKPLSVSTEGVDELIAEAASRRVVVRVAYVHRSIPTIIAAREILQSGRLGSIRHVSVVAGQNFPSFRPSFASTYYAKRATGGGCIQDSLTHLFHAVEWLVAPITKVFCDASNQALETREVEDTVNVTARLQGDIPASFSCNQFQAPNEITITAHGLLGSIKIALHQQRLGVLLAGESCWTWTQIPPEERDAMFIRQAHAFLDATQGKSDTLASLAAGLQTLKVNLAALRSSDERTEITIEPPPLAR
jgi:predicted dehydrogenase